MSADVAGPQPRSDARPAAAPGATPSTPGRRPRSRDCFCFGGVLGPVPDKAPAHPLCFDPAGGDVERPLAPLATTLAAVSAGSVFMGVDRCIGPAPKGLVEATADDPGVRRPPFLGWTVWSVAMRIPLFVVPTFVWWR